MKYPPDWKKKFAPVLLAWNRNQNTRSMPWKGEKDPYKVWLSEIILQQTRVEQGLHYYARFVKAFPNIHKLARASKSRVFKLWEGLGYYTRCRNLMETARHISITLQGQFPDSYSEILKLKGVGPYTAAAISSFAYGLPYPVIDGNVYRILARVSGTYKPIDSSKGKLFFERLANELFDKEHPSEYNQAIMDFGATVCKPSKPDCPNCVFQKTCMANKWGKIAELPVKQKKLRSRQRWFYYLVTDFKKKTLITKRSGKDIWNGLYEFILVEAEKEITVEEVLHSARNKNLLTVNDYSVLGVSPMISQKLSHQRISGRFIRLCLNSKPELEKTILVEPGSLKKFAFPAFINSYLEEYY